MSKPKTEAKPVRQRVFCQAAAAVASGLNENKQSIAYMNSLSKLDRTLEQEILKGSAA